MNNCVAAIDAGTGGVRCVIYDPLGNALSQYYCETSPIYTPDGRAEQDPGKLVDSAFDAVKNAIAAGNIDPGAIAGVSISGTQTTFAPVGRDGRYLSNLILWQDMRGTEMFPLIRERFAAKGLSEADLYDRTLRALDALAAGPKLMWFRERMPELYDNIRTLANPQSVLLTAFGAEDHTVDITDTGWWLCHDRTGRQADPDLADVFGFDPDIFPAIALPGEEVGRVSPTASARSGLMAGTPLFQGAVDQCCAAMGAGNGGEPALGSLCMGTAGVIMNCSPKPVPDPLGRYYVINYPTGGFAREFAIPVAASAFRWVRDMLYPAESYDHRDIYRRMDAEAATAQIGCGGLVFLPQMAGSIYPRTDASVRGGYTGFSMSTTRADMVRAALEGVSFGMRHILEASGNRFDALRLLGGGARSPFWNQMQADVYGCPVETIATEEASALGAAMIAAAGAGLYPSLKDAVRGMSRIKRRYEPAPSAHARYSEVYGAWLECVRALEPRAFPALAAVRATKER